MDNCVLAGNHILDVGDIHILKAVGHRAVDTVGSLRRLGELVVGNGTRGLRRGGGEQGGSVVV